MHGISAAILGICMAKRTVQENRGLLLSHTFCTKLGHVRAFTRLLLPSVLVLIGRVHKEPTRKERWSRLKATLETERSSGKTALT